MTDSILNKSYYYSTTTVVPFPIPVAPAEGALALLDGESEGFAIDATTYDSITAAAYVGAPVGGTVAVIDAGTPANDLSNVALAVSNLTQAGTSAKTVHWPTSPYVRWAPHNLMLRSQELDHATWATVGLSSITANSTTAPDGTTTVETLTEDSGNTRHIRYQLVLDALFTPGETITASVYLKRKDRQWGTLQVGDDSAYYAVVVDLDTGNITDDDGTATGVVDTVGDGWYRVSVTIPASTGDMYLWAGLSNSATPTFSGRAPSYTGDGSSGIYVWGAQINRGPIATSYLVTTSATRVGIPLGYDAITSQYGMLIESAATNYIATSEDFNTAFPTNWGGTITVTANDTTAPDGTTTADRVLCDNTNDEHGRHNNGTMGNTPTDAVHTFSAYLKQDTHQYVVLTMAGAVFAFESWAGATFDLTNGTITDTHDGTHGTTDFVSAEIVDVGDGWYRCSVSAKPGSTGWIDLCSIQFANSATQTLNDPYGQVAAWDAAGTEAFWVWGTQIVAQPIAGSYIPTFGATATRTADHISALTSTYPHDDALGSVVAAIRFPSTIHSTTNSPRIVQLDNGADPHRNILYANPGDTTFGYSMVTSSSLVVVGSITETGTVDVDGNKAAIAWQLNNAGIVADGGAEVVDTTCTMPTVTRLILGSEIHSTSGYMNGYIYTMYTVPRRMTEAELQAATT